MKFKLPSRTTRNLRIALVTLSSSNSLIIIASIGFKNSNRSTQPDLLLIPQVNVCIITIFYAYFKLQLLPFIYGQLLASSVLAGIFLFFAGKIFPLLQDYSDLFWVVQGFNVLLAILLLTEAICTFFVGKSEQELQAETLAANRRARATQDEAPGDNITTPAAVHLYQPRLDFSPLTEDGAPPHNRTSVISSSTADREAAVLLEIPDDYELDELPKYQRKPPAQSATIIDLSNLASVNPEVLNNVVRPLSSSSMSTLSEVESPGTQRPPSALIEQGGQQSSRDEDVPSSDVPEYSPAQPSLSTSSSSAPSSAPSSGPTSSSLSPPSTPAADPSSHAAPAPAPAPAPAQEPPLYVP